MAGRPAGSSAASSASTGLLAVVALAGAGTMVVELSAVRLLAPWFGASVGVWTNVIGVVLLALSLGYLLGARLAAGRRPERALGFALLFAALTSAWLPAAAGLVAGRFLPAGVTLDRASELVAWGSLASACVLFLPAALALGCVGPLAVELVQVRGRLHAGTAGGRVLFASTLGSLAGTFGTTHLFLPTLGLRWTFSLAGALLALLGLAVLASYRRGGPLALLLALAATAGVAAPPRTRPELPETLALLAARESPYQSVRVVETVGEAAPLRFLQVNESFDSFQSAWQRERGFLPAGFYYNAFALPALWSAPRERWRLCVLGLGAGTAWRVLEGVLPDGVELEATGVEIDPVVVELAREHMGLAPELEGRRVLAGWDARAALAQLPAGSFDEIVLDTYANQTEIPAHLSTVELFRELRERLAMGGWLAVNVGGFGLDDPVVEAVARTAAAAFAPDRVLGARVPFSRNVVLFARRGSDPPAPGSEGWGLAPGEAARLTGAMALEGAWRWYTPAGGELLTDDRNPIDALQRRSIAGAGAGAP